MQKYRAISAGVVLLFSTLGMSAQVASGNVAESTHPRAEVLQAQNPRIQRSVEGCLVQQDSEYLLNSEPAGVIRLRADSSAMLTQHIGRRVKVRGNMAPAVAQDEEDAGAGASPLREMAVTRIVNVAGSCPAK